MCLQYLLGPFFAYNGLDRYQYEKYQMKIPEYQYFAYAIPAVLCFIIGLHVTGKLKGEIIDRDRMKKIIGNNVQIPYLLIIIGFVSSLVTKLL